MFQIGPSVKNVGHWGRGLARDIESLLLPLSLLLPAYYNMSDFPHRNRLKSNETLKPGTETSKMGAKQPFPVLKVKVLYHSGQKLPHAENYSWFHTLWERSKRAHLTAGLWWWSQLLFYTLFFFPSSFTMCFFLLILSPSGEESLVKATAGFKTANENQRHQYQTLLTMNYI